MQRVGSNRRVINGIIFVLLTLLFIAVDQFTKFYFKMLSEEGNLGVKTVINDFFYLTYLENRGAAYGFLSGKSWAQQFFKGLTVVALILFIIVFIYSLKKGYNFLSVGISMVIGGTVGNFIDRIMFSAVSDFLNIRVFGKDIFGVFNLADVFLCVGVAMFIIHCLFLDKNALFRKNEDSKDTSKKWLYWR